MALQDWMKLFNIPALPSLQNQPAMKGGSAPIKSKPLSKENEYVLWVHANNPEAGKFHNAELRDIYKKYGDKVYEGQANPPERLQKKSVLGAATNAFKQSVKANAQEVSPTPKPYPTIAPDADQFEKTAYPILKKYDIPPAVAFGMRHAEGGKIGSNNVYNMNATDSNPNGAYNYATPADAVEDFAKTISTSDRYEQAYKDRSNPDKMLEDIQNAGYAGDPKTWKQRSASTGGAGKIFDTYKDFVKNTPGYKRYSQ